LSRVLCRDSDCAEDSTRDDADPVSPAPRLTSVMLLATSAVLRRRIAGDRVGRQALAIERGRDG
jgi:hypothetical protein